MKRTALYYLAAMAVGASVLFAYTYGFVTGSYLVASGVVGYAIFCRLVIVSKATWKPIRVAFVLIGTAIIFSLYMILFAGHKPSYSELFVMVSMAVLLVTASRRWRQGTPTEFATDRMDLERAGSL